MVSRAARDYESLYRRIREDIFALCRALNFTPTWQQAEVLREAQRAVNGRGYMAVKSGQGPGKSTIVVIVAIFRILQRPKSLCVLTAPTQRQCRDAFLTRAREIVANAEPMLRKIIEVTASRIKICGDPDWGVKTVTASDPKNAQGYHVPAGCTLTIIGDEASGIDREILEQFIGTISNPLTLMLLIGNPNLRDCFFFDCFNLLRDKWWTYTMNAEDTARDYPHLLSPARNQDIADIYGRESDVYRIRVLGEFPFQDPNSVISSEDLEECTRVGMTDASLMTRRDGKGFARARQFGLDFSRYGGDESVVYQRLGNAIIDEWRGVRIDPNDVVSKSIAMQIGCGWSDDSTLFVPDAGGIGQGVIKGFHGRGRRRRVLEFHSNGTAANNKEYANMITEAWFNVARLAKARQMRIPKDNLLIKQLSTRKYTTNKLGQLIIWSKDDYMDEGNDSPDRGDACVMVMYDGSVVGGQSVRQPGGSAVGGGLRAA